MVSSTYIINIPGSRSKYGTATPTSKFLPGDLVAVKGVYGRVATPGQFKRDTGESFDVPTTIIGNFAVIVLTPEGYILCPENSAEQVYDPKAEITRLRKLMRLDDIGLAEDVSHNVEAKLALVREAIGEEQVQRLRGKIQTSLIAADAELASLMAKAQRNIEYLEHVLRVT